MSLVILSNIRKQICTKSKKIISVIRVTVSRVQLAWNLKVNDNILYIYIEIEWVTKNKVFYHMINHLEWLMRRLHKTFLSH